jgi:CheY-like chemotaxis protein
MTEQTLNGVRILVVEDNFVVADALRFMLAGYGGVVTAVVPSVERALAAMAEDPFDVAILDINLHGRSVVPFADHLLGAAVPFVFVSGYGDEDLLPEHLRAHPRFDKPVEAERLVGCLVELARRH